MNETACKISVSSFFPRHLLFHSLHMFLNLLLLTIIHPHSDICQHLDTTARECYATSIEVLEQALSASAVEAMHLRDEAAALQVILQA